MPHYPIGDPQYVPQTAGSPDLAGNVEKAVNGEYEAIHYYEKLAELAGNEQDRRRILRIRADEIRHYRQFSHLYVRLTGKQPRVAQPKLPAHFLEGVKDSIVDELEAAEFYQNIAASTNDPQIAALFSRAAADELRHAVWFEYIWLKSSLH